METIQYNTMHTFVRVLDNPLIPDNIINCLIKHCFEKNIAKTHHFTEHSLALLLKITRIERNLQVSQSSNTNNDCKILKAYIIQRPFLMGLFLEGLIYIQREICVSKSATCRLILGGKYASQNPQG